MAAVVPILLELLSHPRGHKYVAAVHPCPHSGCGPRRSGPDQLSHQLSSPGWVQYSREFVSSLGTALHCVLPHAEVLFLEPEKVQTWGL